MRLLAEFCGTIRFNTIWHHILGGMVKLQKHKAYTYKTDAGEKIDHYKHIIIIPEEMVDALGWQNGVELQPIMRNNSLVLKPADVTKGSKTLNVEE